MKTADDWRNEYYFTHGKPIEPGTLLADVLRDMEQLESDVDLLQSRLMNKDAVKYNEKED